MSDFLWAVIPLAMGCYFAFRYFALKRSLREAARDLGEIQQHIAENQMLHLPLPDRDLEQFLQSVNGTLEELRRERLTYETREREFQLQIENISHDLRTPLTVILGYLKWLKCPQGSQDVSFTESEALEVIERNARSMEHLVSQFYAFSRLNGPDFTLELGEVDMCRILRESLADNYQLLEKPDFHLDCCLPEHPVMVSGNKEALERLFANLLQNAGRYARSYLDIRMEESGGQVQVLFQNDSDRLLGNDLPSLFKRFYKNDAARSKGGSGLGLTIARSLAEAMGGSLTAQALPQPEQSIPQEQRPCISKILFTLTLVRL